MAVKGYSTKNTCKEPWWSVSGRKCDYRLLLGNGKLCGIHDLQKILGNGELPPIPDLPG
jgi:hypothetical protein